MPEVPTVEGSRGRVRALDAGSLWLDGGAMFGVVPKPLWSRRTACDERNRIPLGMRCLLVETDEATVLVDTGLGNKDDEKFREIYAVSNDGEPTRLESSLSRLGISTEDIDVVVNSHLHFDHAGGNTVLSEEGVVCPAFPNARYVASAGEYAFARMENERIRASYVSANFEPLLESGCLTLVTGDAEVTPGVRVLRTPGHTPHHQSVMIDVGEEKLLFLADLVPTLAHLALPWIMGYDVEPLLTLESKRTVLGRAGREGWLLAFEHDPVTAWARAVEPGRDRSGCAVVEQVEHPLVSGLERGGA